MLVYKYGACKPIEGFELLLEQLRLANVYRNQALELALTRAAALHLGVPKDEVKQAYNAAKRELYARYSTAGLLGHRTLYFIDQAVMKAASQRWRCWSKTGRFRSPYRRFDGTGYIVANSQHEVRRFAALTIVGKRKAICDLRVVGKQVIRVPVTLDRPLPDDADVADARLHVDRDGDRWIYSVTFTLRNVERRCLPKGEGTCSVNFGWRRMPDGGVRVATVSSERGESFLVLPPKMLQDRRDAEKLASLADSLAVAHLGSSRGRHRARKEALKGLGPSELNRVRFEPGEQVSREHWARRDRHLWQMECAKRSRAQRQRKEIYRLFARDLRARFATVTIEDYSLAALARSAVDPETPCETAARHVRFLVAPSYLRAEIQSVFGDDCVDLHRTKRTAKCHACGQVCDFDEAAELEHVCEHCGVRWDQDINNARNQQSDVAAE